MTSRRSYSHADDMYGGSRSSRGILDSREGALTAAHHSLSSMSRRQVNALGTSFEDRVSSRGKAIVDEDRSGRVPDYPPRSSRGSDHAEASGYGNTERRSTFRDEHGVTRTMRSDDASRGGEPHRYGEFRVGGRMERTLYKSEYPEESRRGRAGAQYYNSLNNYDGIGGFRGSTSENGAAARSGSHDILSGFIYEAPQRTILEWSLTRASFALTVEDKRLYGQLGDGTYVFLFDVISRDLYGVFQCIGDAVPAADLVGHSQVRVRSVKDCHSLYERDFKDIIRDNYYTSTRFTIGLNKEQVDKLLQSFRPTGVERSSHPNSTPSRSSMEDYNGISDGFTYGRDERRRSQGHETRSFSSHRYHEEDRVRFSSKSPLPVRSARKDFKTEADEYEHVPPHSSPLTSVRGKQHSLRGLSGSRIAAHDQVNTGKHSDLRLSDSDWREEDERDAVYRKRHTLDEPRRGPSSTAWKDPYHSRPELTGVEEYDRVGGRGGIKDDSHYLASLRNAQNQIDLNNTPLDMGHGDPSSSHVRDIDSKVPRRRVVEDDSKRHRASPSNRRSFASRGSDYAAGSNVRVELEDLSPPPEDHPHPRRQEKSRPSPIPASSGFANGNSAPRIVTRTSAAPSSSSRDKPIRTGQLRREPGPAREVIRTIKDHSARTSSVPVLNVNVQAANGTGKTERVVTIFNSGNQRPRFTPMLNDDNNHQSLGESNLGIFEGGGQRSVSRKRKPSVFARLSTGPSPSRPPPMRRMPVPPASPAKGRVFNRLGPPVNTFGPADFDLPLKRARIHPHQNLVWTREQDGLPETGEANTSLNSGENEASPDGSMFDNGTGNSEQADEPPQGWSRKKSGSSGDEGGNREAVAEPRRNRRKIVRPPIEGKPEERALPVNATPATGESDKDSRLQDNPSTAVGEQVSSAQQGSPHESSPAAMDVEMTNGDTKEGTEDVPKSVSKAEVQDMVSNSPTEEGRNSGIENMVS